MYQVQEHHTYSDIEKKHYTLKLGTDRIEAHYIKWKKEARGTNSLYTPHDALALCARTDARRGRARVSTRSTRI